MVIFALVAPILVVLGLAAMVLGFVLLLRRARRRRRERAAAAVR